MKVPYLLRPRKGASGLHPVLTRKSEGRHGPSIIHVGRAHYRDIIMRLKGGP